MWSEFDSTSVQKTYCPEDKLKVLCVSSTGHPLRWIGWRRAATYSALDMIQWGVSNEVIRICSASRIYYLPTILAVARSTNNIHYQPTPPLTNPNLFRRDNFTCMYCGNTFPPSQLTKDHVMPQSRGGKSIWNNITTACAKCNVKKADAPTPEHAGLKLLAIPYEPSYSEYLILSNRRILGDQMEFLKKGLNKNSPLRKELLS